ncbi:M13 family metallopeptidase [Maricaulis salignorans]|uniref:Endothelin-converting enzyme Metallo peptidase. MEROPS family M13 n=1 Tax=Maricaulis salignorans TaxID=144026 RepID=A0A1G9WWR7_9PROT|nr:M13 family metallopeptidase [Maricaulis salignorans]SDM88563.1 endothelin-converting enzyme Metallo peptidase. MEROPS family M13 [Maricaulis salignorans]
MKKILLGTVCLAFLAACSPAAETPSTDTGTTSEAAAQAAAPSLGAWGIETQHISETVAPGDDFFRYVNEGWLDTTEIPAGFSNFGSFSELALSAEERIDAIIADVSATENPAGSVEQQVGDLYASYMDSERLNALGLSPAQPGLDRIAAAQSYDDVIDLFGASGFASLFGAGVGRDAGNPDTYIVYIRQSGLGMPDRDYYLRDDERFDAYRAAYVEYMSDVFGMLGEDNGTERAQAVLDMETAIAQMHWTRAESRDRVASYNPMTIEELQAYAPGFDWARFMTALDFGDQDNVVVSQNTAVQSLASFFREIPLETWKDYLTLHYMDSNRNELDEAFYDRSFDFWSRTLSGTEEPRARDRRAIQYVNGPLGQAIGRIYVERHFPAESKAEMEDLVDYLRRALGDRIETLEWMDDETRAEALDKLAKFTPKIAYPDQWPDYSSIEIRPDDLFGNSERISAWYRSESRARLRGPIREWEWGMSPQTVNAYYSSTANEIVFPAAILQGPFFDANADPAVNFGGIGAVIGHEMGHGFDDQGSQSDGDGLLRNWWTDFSREQFDARTDQIVAQYEEFSPVEGMFVNGRLTLGENIGDIGGLSMAYRAYHMYLADHGGEAPVIDGFTGDQRFFMAWAQVWRRLYTEDNLVARITTDPHSPSQYRTNGVVRNMDVWYEAFGVTEDDALYLPPEERVSVW